MKSTALAILPLLASAAPSHPPQTAHLTFLSSSLQPLYNLSVLANGIPHPSPDLTSAVARVAAPDYNAAALCALDFGGQGPPPEHVFVIGEDGHTGQVRIEPPTAVRAISCEGVCVDNYARCDGGGRGPRLCCNGYCAASLCRPWDGV
ncbi:hypothetical protein ISF_09505 [Cordyceps fumosorosea ARSEF 2679]|uniref:SSCRP protein n=1 Tax=Cordyceps fumosorosea (strain ARSEF 2679) TaxID=1081104 RepID=A0A167HJ56_CORFA|nr:hypothetical protein ISF_09505 [Cordyceps fumosorosea ARSEF 2679]OAA47973.1 hypothetical protein ISF_09505 [Cordyceps fumosorosea ARSEF 2679]